MARLRGRSRRRRRRRGEDEQEVQIDEEDSAEVGENPAEEVENFKIAAAPGLAESQAGRGTQDAGAHPVPVVVPLVHPWPRPRPTASSTAKLAYPHRGN